MGQQILCSRSMGICVFCPRNYTKDACTELPCILGSVGIIFSHTSSMGNISNHIRSERERENSDSDFVLPDFGDSFLHYIPTIFKRVFSQYNLIPKKDMATFVGWKLFCFLGFGLTGLSYWISTKAIILDIQLSQTPVAFQNVVYFLTSIFLFVFCLRYIGKFVEQCIRIKDALEDSRHKKDQRLKPTKTIKSQQK